MFKFKKFLAVAIAAITTISAASAISVCADEGESMGFGEIIEQLDLKPTRIIYLTDDPDGPYLEEYSLADIPSTCSISAQNTFEDLYVPKCSSLQTADSTGKYVALPLTSSGSTSFSPSSSTADIYFAITSSTASSLFTETYLVDDPSKSSGYNGELSVGNVYYAKGLTNGKTYQIRITTLLSAGYIDGYTSIE